MSVLKTSTTILAGGLLAVTILSGTLLSNPSASADTSGTVNIRVSVAASCSLSLIDGINNIKTISNTITPGTRDTIGTANLKAICNDPGGLAVYAIGYTGDVHGETDLVANDNSGNVIETGYTASNPTDSEWYMSIAAVSGDYAPTIPNGTGNTENFTTNHVIPEVYTKVAYRNSNTDVNSTGYTATGANFTATFGAYIAPTQPSGVYEGKVKFTLVHPSTHEAPASRPATLDTGQVVNSKMKSLAAGASKAYTDWDSLIKGITVSTGVDLTGFPASEANTISSSTSERPIYILFDSGTMRIFTNGDKIILPADSSDMFFNIQALTDLSALSDWDASGVTNMHEMFFGTGYQATAFNADLSGWDTSSVTDMSDMFGTAGQSATTWWSIGDLSGWDTSSVTNMSGMFNQAGYDATTWSIGDLSGWDTSSVTDMSYMFEDAGGNATTWSIGDLSGWDTSSVTDMYNMFYYAGYSATDFSLNLSSWDTSSVTNMTSMFGYAGYSATDFSLNLSSWDTSSVTTQMGGMFSGAGYTATPDNWLVSIPYTNGNGISNTTSRLYGNSSSNYASPDYQSGKVFTLAP